MKFIEKISLKAITTGAVLAFLIGFGDPYGNFIFKAPAMAQDTRAPGAGFLFFILVGAILPLLRLINRRLAFNRSELITIYFMMLVASAIPTWGIDLMLSTLGSATYFATPENEWADIVHPYIPKWMILSDPSAIKYYYEGLPKGMSIPWGAWIRPLLAWIPFLLVLYAVMISISVILRRQWMDNEKLTYPIIQPPLSIIQEEGSSLINPFFKNRLMWMGFLISAFFLNINFLHEHFYFIPKINLEHEIIIFRNTNFLRFYIDFALVGFTYFINLDVAFSLWFFNLLLKLEKGYLDITGHTMLERLGPYSPGRSPIFIHQNMGAMIVLVVMGLWVGRKHLKNVFRKAFKNDPEIDDSDEILSYRAAVLILTLGFIFIISWLRLSGIPLWVILPFLFAVFVLFIGLSRIVCQSGMARVSGPMTAQAFISSGFGSSTLGPKIMVPLGYTFVWVGEINSSVLTFSSNGLKLVEGVRSGRRIIFWALLLAIAASITGAIWAVMKCAHAYGGLNLARFQFWTGPRAPFAEYAVPFTLDPEGPRWDGWLHTGIGAGIMLFLIIAQRRFVWWPLHPIGFPISGVWALHNYWFSVALVWLIKWTILKYGGPRTFRNLKPFFLGLILGDFATVGLWVILRAFIGPPSMAPVIG